MQAPELQTDRLLLRAIRMADWEPYAAMWADARVTRYIGGEPRTRAVAWTKFGQGAGFWALLGYGYWSILDHAGGYLGVGGFARHERGIAELGQYPECGWTFANEAWGRGIASEAVRAMCAWADAAGLPETRCIIAGGNIASVKVAERVGYVACAEFADNERIFRRPAPVSAD